MKVLLINPMGFGDLSGQGVNVGLGYLASSVLEQGHDARVLDLNTAIKIPNSERIHTCVRWLPDFVGVSINSFNVRSAINLIKELKIKLPHATFWAGGPHITIVKEKFLKRYATLFDGLVVGEGDSTIKELLAILDSEKPHNLETVAGLIIKNANGEIQETPCRELISDIDTLSLPSYEVFDSFPLVVTDWYNLITSRGCPYNCVFCASKAIWRRRWRYRSIENIEKELIEIKKRYDVKKIRVVDDNFSLKKGRAVKILNLLSDHGFEISLTNGIRADTVDEELADVLSRINVSPVVVGVENADPNTFDYVQKGESLEDIERALTLLKNKDVDIIVTMIIGLINTTPESVTRSIEFLKKLNISGHWLIALPFPGTALFTWANDNGRLIYDYDQFHAEGITRSMVSYPPPVCFDTPEYPAEKRIEDFERANLIFGNYHFLYNNLDGYVHVVIRLILLIIKHDVKRIGFHIKGLTRLSIHILYLKLKQTIMKIG